MADARRALVLGGGGITGIAWELGVLAGLAAAGVQLQYAGLLVGTSAGSVVGALLSSGRPVQELYEGQLRPASGELAASVGPGVLLRYLAATASSRDERKALTRLGRMAVAARTVSVAERRAVIESRLDGIDWPSDRRLLITAVDAGSGELRVFEAGAGVSLVDAVAASCAVPLVWPTVPIGGHRYLDGGMRSATNADLATGAERVVVLAPITQAFRRSRRLSSQLATLGAGVRSTVVAPDAAARSAFGRNALDPARRAPAARAGYAQAGSVADAVRAVWS
jgi:NTE family protein